MALKLSAPDLLFCIILSVIKSSTGAYLNMHKLIYILFKAPYVNMTK